MVWAAMMGVALSAQPPVPAREITYIPLRGEHAALMEQIERALPRMAPPGVSLRRANRDASRMEACLARPSTPDATQPCIRALVPESPRGGRQVVALRVSMQAVSNVTGSRIHYRHQLHCIGARSIGTAALGDHARPAGQLRDSAAAEIRACLTTAMTPRHAAALSRDGRTGAPLLRLGLNSYIPDDAALARGQASERALVDVQQVRRRPGAGGRCLVRVRVAQVDGYFFLRQGDMIEVAAPCAGEARARFERAVAAPIRPRSRARIYVDYDGEMLFLEPL